MTNLIVSNNKTNCQAGGSKPPVSDINCVINDYNAMEYSSIKYLAPVLDRRVTHYEQVREKGNKCFIGF